MKNRFQWKRWVMLLAGTVVTFQTAPMPVQGQAVDDLDRTAAESHHAGSWSLHNGPPIFSDGAKGGTVRPGYEAGMLTGESAAVREKYRTANIYCFRDAILLAQYLDSYSPILSRTKANIYTASHFKISQVIKADGSTAVGQTIVVYRDGGEVQDEGELLRIDTPDAPPYKAGRTYLLYLNRDKNAVKRQYKVWDEGTTVVVDGRVYPSVPRQAGFLPGTSTIDVVGKFAEANCPP